MVQEVFVELVEEFKETIPITNILKLFDIPSTTYYRWKNNYNVEKTLDIHEQLVIDKCKETNYCYG